MPSNVTDWGASQYLSIIHGLVSLPAHFYVALCTDEPGIAVDGTILVDIEPLDVNYSRVEYGVGADWWSDPSIGQYLANLQSLDFGVPGIDWGVINHFAICDSSTAGNVYAYGEFNLPTYISSTYQVVIPAGALNVALRNVEPSIVGN